MLEYIGSDRKKHSIMLFFSFKKKCNIHNRGTRMLRDKGYISKRGNEDKHEHR